MNDRPKSGTVVIAALYTRELLIRHPDDLFVFGDNVLRTGHGGQAFPCRGMPNAVGIVTKMAPTRAADAYLKDTELKQVSAINLPAWFTLMTKLQEGGRVWLPRDGLGTGLAELPRRAPKIFADIQAKLAELRRMAAKIEHR